MMTYCKICGAEIERKNIFKKGHICAECNRNRARIKFDLKQAEMRKEPQTSQGRKCYCSYHRGHLIINPLCYVHGGRTRDINK